MLVEWIATVLCLLVMAAGGIFWRYCCKLGMGTVTLRKRELVEFAGFALLGFVFFLFIVLQNRYVYFWDYSTYWKGSYETMQSLYREPFQTLAQVYRSILQDDYNQLLPLFIALPLRLFGYTFVRYTAMNYIFFLVPVWFILLCTVKKIAQTSGWGTSKSGSLPTVVTLTMLLTFSGFYVATFRGYIDVACLLPASISILLFVDHDPCSFQRKNLVRDVAISINLLLTFLFRRYFAYFVVGYIVAYCGYAVCKIVTAGKTQKKASAIAAVQNLMVIGGIAMAILLVFFRQLVFRVLATNYAAQYVAYNASMKDKLNALAGSFGQVCLLIALVGVVLGVVFGTQRKMTLFLLIGAVTSCALFFRVQNMGCQHIYIVAVPLFLLTMIGIGGLYALIKNRVRLLLPGVALLLSVLSFAYGFFPACRATLQPYAKYFVSAYSPLQRNDIPALWELATYLNQISAQDDQSVYVLASGMVLNSSILACLDLPEQENAVHNLFTTADVDLRDGFPVDFLQADIVVTTDPIELHLAEGTQEVVRYLAEQVMDPSSPVGRHFEKLDQVFLLDNGVNVYLYKKTSDFERSDLESIAAYFDTLYPEQKEMFSDRILS